MTKTEQEAVNAAIRDFHAGRGGYYSGPATGVYLQTIAQLQTESAKKYPRKNPRGDTLVGYLETIDSRQAHELTDFDGKGLGWRYDSTVHRWTRPNGDRVAAVVLTKGTGRRKQYAGGHYLGDAGQLFRGEVFGIAHQGMRLDADDLAMSEAEYWEQIDADENYGETIEGDDEE